MLGKQVQQRLKDWSRSGCEKGQWVEVLDENVEKGKARSWKLHEKAALAYKKAGLLGSPEKDLWGEEKGKIIGAFLDSSSSTRAQGIVSLGAPPQKRYAMSWLTLQLCQLPATTDSLHLCMLGGWVSVLLYRRPLMSVLQHSFSLVQNDSVSELHPRLLPLPRRIADELVLLAVLAPLAVSNLGADFMEEVFATDASSTMGAVVSGPCSRRTSRMLFVSCKSKGAYTRLDNLSRHLEREMDKSYEDLPEEVVANPRRPLAYRFAFVEIFAGSAKVTKFVVERGFSTCVPIEISLSEEFDMREATVMRWLSYLLVNKLVEGFMIETPCTTFSIMRRHPLRDRLHPFGFDPQEAQTALGNQLGFRGFQTVAIGARYKVPGALETPNSSKLKNFDSWKDLAAKQPNVEVVRTDSCRFGSVHLKSFKFMAVEASIEKLSRRCLCTSPHVQVAGKYTKESAVYTDELADTLAEVICDAIEKRREEIANEDDKEMDGLENIFVNEVVEATTWSCKKAWRFKKKSHINLLELASVQKLVYWQAKMRQSMRLVNFVDSNVVRCAIAKGRSSSRAIGAMLRRLCATVLPADLYLVTPFVPTRLNPSDDPTRSTALRKPSKGVDLETLSDAERFMLSQLPKMRRWISNWTRVVFRVTILHALSSRGGFRSTPLAVYRPSHYPLDFEKKTLGFPGEGPYLGFVLLAITCIGRVTVGSALSAPSSSVFVFVCPVVLHAMPIMQRSSADRVRAVARASQPLEPGRRVLPVTRNRRTHLLQAFLTWTTDEGIDWDALLKESHRYLDEINAILIKFGRGLYEAGRPYNHYAETINAITAQKPPLRRCMQPAWNLAFGWLHNEPGAHHIAMPPQVLLCLMSIALLWGWPRVAGCLALGFGGLCRAGEILASTRRLLLLPSDVHYTINHALLSIVEPKTRFTSAKHQVAKIDQPDMLQVLHVAFEKLEKHQRLWPYSGQTLRTRFRSLLQAAKLDTTKSIHGKLLDLGSLRAGGATWMIGVTENTEITRRRGRWINTRTLEIYVQEVAAAVFLADISPKVRDHVVYLAQAFPKILERVLQLHQSNVLPQVWPVIFSPSR